MTEYTTFDDLNEWFRSPAMATDTAPLNKLEQVSIRALASYAAYEHGVTEDLILNIMMAHFGIDDIARIRRCDYGKVTGYLIDMKLKEIIN